MKKIFLFILFFFQFFFTASYTQAITDEELRTYCEGESCVTEGEYCGVCQKERGNCPEEAGVLYVYQCTNGEFKQREPDGSACNNKCVVTTSGTCKNISLYSANTLSNQYHIGYITNDSDFIEISFQVEDMSNFTDYYVSAIDSKNISSDKTENDFDITKQRRKISLFKNEYGYAFSPQEHIVTVRSKTSPAKEYCSFEYEVRTVVPTTTPTPAVRPWSEDIFDKCILEVKSEPDKDGKQFTPDTAIWFKGTNFPSKTCEPAFGLCLEHNVEYRYNIEYPSGEILWFDTSGRSYSPKSNDDETGIFTSSEELFEVPSTRTLKFNPSEKDYIVRIYKRYRLYGRKHDFVVVPNCGTLPFNINAEGKGCPKDYKRSLYPKIDLCKQIGQAHTDIGDWTDCEKCTQEFYEDPGTRTKDPIPNLDGYDYKGLWTAIGCVPTDVPTILKKYVWPFGLGMAGGVAFLYFLLIIFSIFILQVIGVQILQIPGFGPTPTPSPGPGIDIGIPKT